MQYSYHSENKTQDRIELGLVLDRHIRSRHHMRCSVSDQQCYACPPHRRCRCHHRDSNRILHHKALGLVQERDNCNQQGTADIPQRPFHCIALLDTHCKSHRHTTILFRYYKGQDPMLHRYMNSPQDTLHRTQHQAKKHSDPQDMLCRKIVHQESTYPRHTLSVKLPHSHSYDLPGTQRSTPSSIKSMCHSHTKKVDRSLPNRSIQLHNPCTLLHCRWHNYQQDISLALQTHYFTSIRE